MVVTIRNFAVELGKSRAALKTHCRVRGYPFSRLRTPGSRGSLAVAISDADAQRVRAHYAREWCGVPRRFRRRSSAARIGSC